MKKIFTQKNRIIDLSNISTLVYTGTEYKIQITVMVSPNDDLVLFIEIRRAEDATRSRLEVLFEAGRDRRILFKIYK